MQTSSRPTSAANRNAASPLPRHQHQVNTQTKVLDTAQGRVLCVADIRGRISGLNDYAREHNAQAILHCGDFGFFEANSIERIHDRTLRHLTMYSPLIPSAQRSHLLSDENSATNLRSTFDISMLSEFPLLLSGQIKLQVPVYTVWGACEDVLILEKFRQGTYSIENLHVLDEATTRCIDAGGVKLRLFGLGGALVYHKLFDNGEGRATIAGGQGTMWTTALQIGELVDTAQRVFDPTETRVLITHAAPGREGIMAQLALVLKADLTISAGLHFRYATSYNEFSVQGDFEGFRHKLALAKENFDRVWDSIKSQVYAVIDDNQQVLLDKALSVVERVPPAQPSAGPGAAATGEEPAWKNCWNWNLCDAAYGTLVLEVKEGRISAELKSQGFNFAYRRTATVQPTPSPSTSNLPSVNLPSKGATPAPQADRATPAPQADRATPAPQSDSAPKTPAVATPAPKAATPTAELEKPTSPTSGKGSPAPKQNGASTPAGSEKGRKKDKKKGDKSAGAASENVKEISTPKTAANSTLPDEVSTPPPTSTSAPNVNDSPADSGPKSPVTDVGSGGNRTPKTSRPSRNPWTIAVKVATQETLVDEDFKEFFGEAKDKVMKVNLLPALAHKPRLAYVEFENEADMKAGLEKHAEKIKGVVPEARQAIDRESGPPSRGPFRGRGRGSGGGFAARGFAAAGLTRGHSFRGSGGSNPGAAGGDA